MNGAFRSILILCFLFCKIIFAQDNVAVTSYPKAAEWLDLKAVAEVFKESDSLEEFEKSLNDPSTGINNFDLNDDMDVDYITVADETDGAIHFIILRVPLGYDEFQDVAVIEVVEVDDQNYKMAISGDQIIYGPDYKFIPVVLINSWPLIRNIYGENYIPHRSPYRWGYYPLWWKPFRPVNRDIYIGRVKKYHTARTFDLSGRRDNHNVSEYRYSRRTSKYVKKNKTAAFNTGHVNKNRKIDSKEVIKRRKTEGRLSTIKRRNIEKPIVKKWK